MSLNWHFYDISNLHFVSYDFHKGDTTMYEIIATEDFINLLEKLPLKYTHVLTQSFISIKKLKKIEVDNTFLCDLLEQIRNHEME